MEQEQQLSFPLNEKLLSESEKIKQNRQMVRDRLRKVEETKASVSPTVYERVKSDYLTRFKEASDQLLEKKNDIDRELATLYENRRKVGDNLKKNQEDLEEIEFRHQLGEFNSPDYDNVRSETEAKIQKFEKILQAIGHNIDKYESIFADASDLLGEEELSAPLNAVEAEEKTPLQSSKKSRNKISEEESDYMIMEEKKDYFSSDTGTKTEDILDDGQHTEVTNDATSPDFAKIVIVKGANAGTEYTIRNEATIGRSSGNDIILKEAKVSRQHAIIKKHGSGFVVYDLQSSNGVFVNQERVNESVLSDGDKVQIGDFVLQFQV